MGHRLVIIGAGGHATSVADVAMSAGFDVVCFVDTDRQGQRLLGRDIIASVDEAGPVSGLRFALAVGDNALRARLYSGLSTRYPGMRFPSLVHRAASVSPHARLGEGTVVMAGAVIGPASSVDRFCIINTLAALDHDSEMGEFSSLAPGARTGGRVTIGAGSVISIGAVVREGSRIGAGSVVGAASYVHEDVPDGVMAWGVPAQVRRKYDQGEAYLKSGR